MELRHLITFKTIAENNSFKKAANILGYAQSTITSHIKLLEDEFNIKLFDRLGKQVKLTQFGENFIDHAKEMIELYEEMNILAKEHNNPMGQIKIGTHELLASYRLPKLLVEFQQSFPDLKILLVSIEGLNIENELKEGRIDLAFTMDLDSNRSPYLKYIQLNREKMSVIESNKATNLSPILFREKNCAYKDRFNKYVSDNQIPIGSTVDFLTVEAIKQCVENGLGIAMIPHFTIIDEVKDNHFKHIEVQDNYYSLNTYLVYHKNKYLSSSLTRFIEFIKDYSIYWKH